MEFLFYGIGLWKMTISSMKEGDSHRIQTHSSARGSVKGIRDICAVGGWASSCFVLVLTGFSSRETGLLSGAQMASWLTRSRYALPLHRSKKRSGSTKKRYCSPSFRPINLQNSGRKSVWLCVLLRTWLKFWRRESARGSSKLEYQEKTWEGGFPLQKPWKPN